MLDIALGSNDFRCQAGLILTRICNVYKVSFEIAWSGSLPSYTDPIFGRIGKAMLWFFEYSLGISAQHHPRNMFLVQQRISLISKRCASSLDLSIFILENKLLILCLACLAYHGVLILHGGRPGWWASIHSFVLGLTKYVWNIWNTGGNKTPAAKCFGIFWHKGEKQLPTATFFGVIFEKNENKAPAATFITKHVCLNMFVW